MDSGYHPPTCPSDGAWRNRVSGASAILTFPEAVWELSLGIYLTVKGFKAAPGFFDHTRNGAAADGALTPAAAAR
jgi:hypothetical protein